MKIEMRKLSEIKPYEQNPRVNDNAVDAVAGSIKEFGFRQPIVVDAEGVIVCGHTRWKAAQKLGLEKVPVHVAKDLTPEQVRAYRIADNRLAELAEWDKNLLPLELEAIRAAGTDLSLLGFDEESLAQLLDAGVQGGQTDPDAVPEPPDKAVSVRGEIYQLGEHRLMCGDSGSVTDLDLLLGGARISLVNTDPPYNVKVEPRSNNAIAAGLSSFGDNGTAKRQHLYKTMRDPKHEEGSGLTHHQAFDLARGKSKFHATTKKLRPKDRPLENDFVSDEAFEKMLRAWFGNIAGVLQPGRAFYIWGGYANCGNYPPVLKTCELYFSQAIIWVKEHPVLTRKDYMGNHEWCFYGWRLGAGHKFYGPNNAPDVWPIKKVNPQSMIHLTEKPVELAVRAIQYSSVAGENVLDLFGGSGSTLIACEQTKRHAFLMELDTLYCDVIRQRWAEFAHGKNCDWKKLTSAVKAQEARKNVRASRKAER
ncbi:MAG: DNA methyltransferase [Candidatus Brocadiia bacterium]|jgi:DNA modification methylase